MVIIKRMNKLLILCILLISVICVIECRSPLLNRSNKGKYIDKDLNLDAIQYQYYTQSVDHFDPLNSDTFQQRYIVNDQYWNGTGPVFFMINGEGPMDSPGGITDFQYNIWGKQVGALVVALEHRYYGASFVTPDLSNENLIYLTIEQALADNAEFLVWYLKEAKVPSTSSVVGFGGSYAGALTSWFRIKYPQLVDFTISSSAPVNVVLDFYQYLQVTQTTILSVPNGQQCLDNIIIAHSKLVDMVQSDSLFDLTPTFNLCDTLNDQNDISTFIQQVAGNWMGTGQYNDESPSAPRIEQMCDMMVNTSNDPFENYVQVWNEFSTPGQCNNVSYSFLIAQSTNTTNDEQTIGGRLWQWQLCTQFGYFITSDAPEGTQPFGNLFGYEFQTQQCQDIFGIKGMMPNINTTITEYGGLYPNVESTDEILYVTGTNDNWSAIGISPLTNPTIKNTLLIKDTTHCADMMPPTSVSPPTLAPAQQVIFEFIQSHLSRN